MSLQTIEIEAFSGPTSVLIGGGNQPTIVYINQGPAGSAGSSNWGDIAGTLSSQTDLQDALNLKANLASPTFTGTVVLPSTTSIGNVSATEIGYVDGVTSAIQTQLNAKAPLASPTFTGIVTAPRITGRCDGLEVLCKAGLAIAAGQVVYVTGASGNNIVIGLARANAEATSSKTIGISESTLAHNATGYVITEGLMTVSISAPTANEGDPIWLSPTTAGSMVFGLANKPSAPNHIVYLGVVTRKTGNTVFEIYVKIQNGAELDELSDVSITSPVAGQALMRGASLWENRALVSNDISDSSTGGNGTADAGKLVEFGSTGGVLTATVNKVTITQPANGATLTIANGQTINAGSSITTNAISGYIQTGEYASITTGSSGYILTGNAGWIQTGENGYIQTAAGASIQTSVNGQILTSTGGSIITSVNAYIEAGASISTGTGGYIQTATNARITTATNGYISTGANAPISTLNGGSITTGTGNLLGPNTSGTIALTNPSTGTQTFSGAQSFAGQVQLTGQAATDANSAMTRGLALAEEAFNLHNYGFGINSSGGTQGAAATQSRSGSSATGYGRTIITSNAMRSGSSGGITMLANVPVAAAIFGSADVNALVNGGVVRLIVGDPGGNTAVPPRFGGQDALVARGFGAEIFYSTENARQEIRLFAHNGTSYVTSGGVAFPNGYAGTHTILVSSDGLGTIKLFAFTSGNSFLAPQRPTLFSTLTGGPSGNVNLGGSFITVVCVNEGTVAPTSGDAFFAMSRSKFITGALI